MVQHRRHWDPCSPVDRLCVRITTVGEDEAGSVGHDRTIRREGRRRSALGGSAVEPISAARGIAGSGEVVGVSLSIESVECLVDGRPGTPVRSTLTSSRPNDNIPVRLLIDHKATW